ncbi:YhdH/YhfP family quinone oxidoreductase [Geomonas subterranea]|uniref:YhdH/YhfP family quinone oxidoreductase n=1 Tax=Geomonas subterranea TaxID=2847989 RepID=A0ABX8LED0_9BACT|nr:YhdH/YhfP family quinone oxidoreductase [Geomonas subterranea]QXE90410.1 YhdH/YhfP family quinone oxidoreductase [Geomonas subterranea]QXM11515.1 YhdH/YhfP family quinone oxidoreductase [Geomonas subterranea]
MQTRTSFKALVVEKGGDQTFTRSIKERDINELDAGELLVRVSYSSLNYKDALSATGHPGVTRQFPHTPGIDAAGEVVSCSDGSFTPGDQVLVTGHDLGMETDGGWGEYIRVPSSWGVPLPSGLSLRESMILGTAGFTAGLSVLKLERAGVRPESGDILVTGATGGVGTLAVSILAKAGYRVVAATGKMGDVPFLTEMGAAEVISREEVTAGGERPLMKERWAGAVDVVGGETLAAVLKSTRYGGTVTCCGLVGSADLPVNVHPFILRAVTLVGIDSSRCPTLTRLEVWQRLAGAWRPAFLEQMATEVTLEGLEEKIGRILRGGVRGRVLVRL